MIFILSMCKLLPHGWKSWRGARSFAGLLIRCVSKIIVLLAFHSNLLMPQWPNRFRDGTFLYVILSLLRISNIVAFSRADVSSIYSLANSWPSCRHLCWNTHAISPSWWAWRDLFFSPTGLDRLSSLELSSTCDNGVLMEWTANKLN